MADYKELIRKAIQALPENNGAARRAVYEKARAALVGQLRGLNPPLAARDITQHRLQLEDCIRQVEQEASEAVIAGLKQNEDLPPQRAALPPPRPASAMRPAAASAARTAPPPHQVHGAPRPGPSRPLVAPTAHPAVAARAAAAGRPLASKPQPASRHAAAAPPHPKPAAAAAVSAVRAATARPLPRVQPAVPAFQRVAPAPVPVPEYDIEADAETIEDIIAAAETDTAVSFEDDEINALAAESEPEVEFEAVPLEPLPLRSEPRPAARRPALAAPAVPRAETRPLPSIVARAEASKAGRGAPLEARRSNGVEPHHGASLPVRQDLVVEPETVEPPPRPSRDRRGHAALSSVREVDLEPRKDGDPQLAIERAIATLEREARKDGDEGGEAPVAEPNNDRASGRRRAPAGERGLHDQPDEYHGGSDAAFARAPVEAERGGGNAITIFLLVFLVLLVGAGGGGYWAWHEGYIDFDAMFGKAQPVVEQASAPQAVPAVPLPAAPAPVAAAPANTAQTNTEPASNTPAQTAEALSAAAPAAAAPVPLASAEPSAQSGSAPKSEDRLTQAAGDSAAPAVAALGTPADGGAASVPDGSHSLLLEASQDGTTGAVPFSGTVEWTKGTDEMGQPTLIGKANIPARNLGVSVLIRKNSDPALPASHLMEINFTVSDSFIGGAISGLPGVLLKNEELVQGTPLVGASARVVGNSFLFALSSSPADETTNQDLLTSRKWIDLAIIYATGKKAIITLEKDDKAEALFSEVFNAWSKVAAAPATK